ncbi:MAG: pyruvate carboxylase subunit B [Candidatus Lernaella stagnicola]|nr:pyruvate carboxylase subunit B [Candidatus Lernaella stagnicola]
MAPAHPLKITDTTLRDAHQSLFATRMRFEDMEPIIGMLDAVGFHSLEVWGGATFDVTHRFLQEDPWERLRKIKALAKHTPLQMLLRGQNLVGYRNYADDVVRAFCLHAVECGMDIFRVFDALNDGRNFEAAFKTLQETDAHIQATLSFSLTERRIGGPVFTFEYYKSKAKEFVEMGAHSLCIKDMAGLLTPQDAALLVVELKKIVDVPIQLHAHFTSGLADLAYMKAAEAGVDIIDCSLAPVAYRSGQPAVEPMIVTFEGTDRDTGLSLDALHEVSKYLESITPKYRHFMNTSKTAVIDVDVLKHQVPGGMLSNLVNQMREAEALDKLDLVFQELPRTRADLGFPPLVTPTSQIVGVQAVMNVLGGERYKLISKEVRDYCYGLYGRPPAPINEEVRKKCLAGYERGETPISQRPGDILEPEMPAAREAVSGFTDEIGDVLTYALYPRTGMDFLRFKHGLDEKAPGEKPRTLEEIRAEEELIKKALAGELSEKPAAPALKNAQSVRVSVDGELFEVQVETDGLSGFQVGAVTPAIAAPTAAPAAPPPPAPAQATAAAPPAPKPQAATSGKAVVEAPMPGTIVRYEVAEGDTVTAGQTVVILEAMKMENALPAPADGTIASLTKAKGETVKRGEVLAVIQ